MAATSRPWRGRPAHSLFEEGTMTRNRWTSLAVAAGLLCGALAGAASSADMRGWQRHVSKQHLFTVHKPPGWTVREAVQPRKVGWSCTVVDPQGLRQSEISFGFLPLGTDARALVGSIIKQSEKHCRNFRLSPKARTKKVGGRTLFLFEGTYADAQGRAKEFTSLVSAGAGTLLCQSIEAPQGQLRQQAPLLMGILGTLRVARFGPTETTAGFGSHALAGGFGKVATPANWRIQDLGKGQVIASDPTGQFTFIAGAVAFYSPQMAAYLPGKLVSRFVGPSRALPLVCVKQGFGSNFTLVKVHRRPQMEAKMRRGLTGGRPCQVEDFLYTFVTKGRRYKGLSLGSCVGNYADAGFSLSHRTLWAPEDKFDAALPVLGGVLASYEVNREAAGAYVVAGLAKYYSGINRLIHTNAENSAKMRRENLAGHMERGRVRDYLSYQTTRMIMGEFDYLASKSGYTVRADHTGLYTEKGKLITPDPYGGRLVRSMTEINSRRLYEQSNLGRRD